MRGVMTQAFVLLFGAGLPLALGHEARAQFIPQTQQQYQPPPFAKPKPKPRRHAPPRRPRETRERAAPEAPPDKRDTVIAAPGSPYHGRAYWVALAQCGGVYFK